MGTSRSGTSWVFDLCASHPDMSMGYESKIPVEGIEVYRRNAPIEDRGGIERLFAALHAEIEDPSNEDVRALLLRPDVIDRALAAHRLAPGWASVCEAIFCSLEDTSHWGNKLLRIELTPTLSEQWPGSKFLVLTRDPRGVMASQSKKFDHSIEYSAMYWNTHARYVHETLGLVPGTSDEDHMVVDLVEMARDPRPALDWAFSSLGLSTEPVDELVARFPGDPDRLDQWRQTLPPGRQRRVEEYCFDQMVALGYSPELATQAKPIGTVKRTVAMVREHGSEILRDPGSIRRKQVGKRVKAALSRGK
ncbi:MAG: sulfotransferase [Microthrixaceae bacterium]